MKQKNKKPNKAAVARGMQVSRSSLYYKSRMDVKDAIIKEQILATLNEHPAYGHKRIALHLGLNKKRILRVMKKYGIKPLKARGKKPIKKDDLGNPTAKYTNQIKNLCPIRANVIWSADFTYLWFQGRFYYLATVIDVFSREIIGIAISFHHNKELVLNAFQDALAKRKPPIYAHSDQGSEYNSQAYIELAESLGCTISMAAKGKPWENGFQESFYSQFKLELGSTRHFQNVGQLVEAIYHQIHYYNYKRIHTKLKMPPVTFAQQF
jgi:putative transposase